MPCWSFRKTPPSRFSVLACCPFGWVAKSGCALEFAPLFAVLMTTVKHIPYTLASLSNGVDGYLWESWWALCIDAVRAFAPGGWLRAPALSHVDCCCGKEALPFPPRALPWAWWSSSDEANNWQELMREGPFPLRRQLSIIPFWSCCFSTKIPCSLLINRWPIASPAAERASLMCPA